MFEAESNLENEDIYSLSINNISDVRLVSMRISYGAYYSGIKFLRADKGIVNYKIWFGYGEWSKLQTIPEGWSIVGFRCESERTNYLINLALIISPDNNLEI